MSEQAVARGVGPGETGKDRTCIGPQAMEQMAGFRRSMRRFVDEFAELPVSTQATCPKCRSVVAAKFEKAHGQVILRYDCPHCGPLEEVHHDNIWTPAVSNFPGSATQTFGGSRIRPIIRRLPRTVETLCPQCCAIITGRVFVEDRMVFMEKSCPDHGHFRDRISPDALLYSKAAWWSFEDAPGLARPRREGGAVCPSDCGLCGRHLSASCLAQVDLTNRCNMRCPVCFANSGVTGRVVEPGYEQVLSRLRALRALRPTPATAVQFTGGEPTVHPEFLRIISTAADMGFSHIQIATNGLKMADEKFARQAADAGLHTLYLQFDGVGEEPYRHTRNHPGIWQKKLAVIENCRALDMKVCLVPTILMGVNDEQVGEIFRFAVDNIDTVSGISFQPVSFTGRIDSEELSARRYTLGDLAHDIAEASGASALRDMYPLSIVVPLSQILEALTGRPKILPSCHPDCAFGTYFLVSPEGVAYPFPQVINVEGMFWEMNRIAADIRRRGKPSWLDKIRVMRMFKRHFNPDAAPPGLNVKRFVRSLEGLVDKNKGRGEGEKFTYKTLLCAGMHFQDRYNFDVDRIRRCVILYSTPAGVFPFCTYNCGPEYRRFVERAFAAPDGSKGQST